MLHGGEIIALEGPLGAGKTVLAAGLCKGLGVEDVVLSPTFVLQEEFHGRVDVVHADLYRLEYESEVEELALWEQAESGNTLIVEWADRYLPIYDAADAAIRLRPAEGDVRAIEVECTPALGSVFESGKS